MRPIVHLSIPVRALDGAVESYGTQCCRRAAEFARRLHPESGLPSVEAFVATPFAGRAVRGPEGRPARASVGSRRSSTGIDDPCEHPEHPDLAIEPTVPVEDAVDMVPAALR